MQIIPSIDLINGSCVRLQKGDFNKITAYQHNPIELIQSYERDGATLAHIVDLDAAKSADEHQIEHIAKIVKSTHLDIQIGGGINSINRAETLFKIGVKKIVIGSLAVNNMPLTQSIIQEFGADKVILALDISYRNQQPYIVTHAWQKQTNFTLSEIIQTYQSTGVNQILCTDISKDGMLKGPSFKLYEYCHKNFPHIKFQASGGVSSLDDLKKLKKLELSGVIIGKALYENNINLKEALQC